jgi:arylsulfatase A-like enzyme
MASIRPDRPNVLFVLTDDQGEWAMGCSGNTEIRTPTLDALARSGVRLDHFFCTSPVCSPARASLLTGVMPSQHGIHDWLRGGNSGDNRIHFLAGHTLITEHLAHAGYRCGLVGKWHLGASDRPAPGFVHWFAHAAGMSAYFDAPFFRGTKPDTVHDYVTDVLAVEAQAFLESEVRNDAPFWLSLSFTAPHSPWKGAHPDELVRLYDDCAFESSPQAPRHPDSFCGNLEAEQGFADPRGNLQGYYAAITGVDRALSRVLATLDRLGLRESTLVVFTSDNGFNCGHHGIWGKGNGTFPQNMYDSSVKVPFIASQPGRIPAGRVSSELASGYDVMPTLLDYLGVEWDRSPAMPGRSLRGVLENGAPPLSSAVVIYDEYGPVRMIRNERWKYVHRYPYGPHFLFDLDADPREARNRVEDADCASVVAELRATLDAWFARYADPHKEGSRLPVWGRGQFAPVGPEGKGAVAFAEKAPDGAFARRTYGKFVDIADANRKRGAG